MIDVRTYLMPPGGGNTISDGVLKYAVPLSVVRENKRYYCSNISDPDETQYRKIYGSQTLEFLYGPDGSGAADVGSEKVTVIFRV